MTIGLFYAVYRKNLAFKPYFILPLGLAAAAYIAFEFKYGERRPADFGLRTDNLSSAAQITFFAFIGPLLGLVLYGFWKEVHLPSHFYYTLILYPLWGILQQLIFQGFFLGNLTRLGAGLWSIPLSALFYSSVHWPSPFMLTITFFGGLFFAAIYYHRPNVIPIGLAHGLVGALLYYVVLGKDPFAKFIGS